METYKEGTYLFKQPLLAIDRIDGHQMVLKAHALQNEPAMQHAAKLIIAGLPGAGGMGGVCRAGSRSAVRAAGKLRSWLPT